jgi:hypothetical protein
MERQKRACALMTRNPGTPLSPALPRIASPSLRKRKFGISMRATRTPANAFELRGAHLRAVRFAARMARQIALCDLACSGALSQWRKWSRIAPMRVKNAPSAP